MRSGQSVIRGGGEEKKDGKQRHTLFSRKERLVFFAHLFLFISGGTCPLCGGGATPGEQGANFPAARSCNYP